MFSLPGGPQIWRKLLIALGIIGKSDRFRNRDEKFPCWQGKCRGGVPVGAQQRIRTVLWHVPRVETIFMGLLQAARLLRGRFRLQEVGGLTEPRFYDDWIPRPVTDKAGHERYQSFCWEVVAAPPHTILREIGRS